MLSAILRLKWNRKQHGCRHEKSKVNSTSMEKVWNTNDTTSWIKLLADVDKYFHRNFDEIISSSMSKRRVFIKRKRCKKNSLSHLTRFVKFISCLSECRWSYCRFFTDVKNLRVLRCWLLWDLNRRPRDCNAQIKNTRIIFLETRTRGVSTT